MEFKLDLKPEDIEAAVTQAIIDSAIGKNIAEIVEDHVKSFASDYSNPLKKAIEEECARLILQVLRDEYAETLKVAIREKMTESVVDGAIAAAWDSFMDKMERR